MTTVLLVGVGMPVLSFFAGYYFERYMCGLRIQERLLRANIARLENEVTDLEGDAA